MRLLAIGITMYRLGSALVIRNPDVQQQIFISHDSGIYQAPLANCDAVPDTVIPDMYWVSFVSSRALQSHLDLLGTKYQGTHLFLRGFVPSQMAYLATLSPQLLTEVRSDPNVKDVGCERNVGSFSSLGLSGSYDTLRQQSKGTHDIYRAPLIHCKYLPGYETIELYTVYLRPGYSISGHLENMGQDLGSLILIIPNDVGPRQIIYEVLSLSQHLLNAIRSDPSVEMIESETIFQDQETRCEDIV